ncbi:Protein ROOT INITIATION DEFECTIVE 3 [Linum perenne]
MEEELLVVASSSIDAGIGCWNLTTGAEQLRHKSCASTPHGLSVVGGQFFASSQLRDPKSSSGSILYWSWSKPHVEVRSFVEEPIKPLVANSEGTYLVGGGLSGNIYLWEVATGRRLTKWRAHLRGVTCLVFNEDDSLIVSGSEDGSVRVWSLAMILDDQQKDKASNLHEYSFTGHTLRITDLVIGFGGGNAIMISASEDRTCKVRFGIDCFLMSSVMLRVFFFSYAKVSPFLIWICQVWSLSKGILLRSVVFPSQIDALALDPGEFVFYAGGRDGKIYVAALSNSSSSSKSQWAHIIGSLSSQSEAVTSLAYSANGNCLLAGSENGLIRVWNPKNNNVIRIFKHAKGPVNNILVIRRPLYLNPRLSSTAQGMGKGKKSSVPPQLMKCSNSNDGTTNTDPLITLHSYNDNRLESAYVTLQVLSDQIRELQQKGSSATAEMEVKKLKHDREQFVEVVEKWKRTYDSLHEFCINELLEEDRPPAGT